MKKIAAVFTCFLSFSSEVFGCKQLGPSEYEGGVYNAHFMRMIREKTPGVEIKCPVEVSSRVTFDAAKFLFRGKCSCGIHAKMLIKSRDFFIATAERLGECSINPIQIGEHEAYALQQARLSCLSGFDIHEKSDRIEEMFFLIGCLAYCGDSESLTRLAKMLGTPLGSLDLANRAYLATNTVGTTWEEHKAFEEQFLKSGIMEYFYPFYSKE
jgi:hypothetical protein